MKVDKQTRARFRTGILVAAAQSALLVCAVSRVLAENAPKGPFRLKVYKAFSFLLFILEFRVQLLIIFLVGTWYHFGATSNSGTIYFAIVYQHHRGLISDNTIRKLG